MSLGSPADQSGCASVVVVTYNHREVVPRCLDALAETLGPRDEVIVVDNASPDGTADMVASSYSNVRLVRSATNDGFGAACNRGARLARGSYLAFLNPDTVPEAGWLDALLAALEAAPGAGLATAKLLLESSPDRIDAFGNDVHISGITTCRGWGEPAERYNRLEDVSAVSGACFAMRARLFDELGGFDERYFLYYEDTDLSLRARLAGYRCVAVPEATVLHDHRPGFSPAKLRYLERNRWWTLLKLYDLRTVVALLPILLLAECFAWAMALRLGPRHVAAKTRAWLDIFCWAPGLAEARRSATATLAVRCSALLGSHGDTLAVSQMATGPVARAGEQLAREIFRAVRCVTVALVTR